MFYSGTLLFLINEWFNPLRPRQNGRHFTNDIFNSIFLTENVWTPTKISLKFVPKGLINNIPALVQIMAWRRPGDKPLSEPTMVIVLTHICITRPQWVNCSLYGPLLPLWYQVFIYILFNCWFIGFTDVLVYVYYVVNWYILLLAINSFRILNLKISCHLTLKNVQSYTFARVT